MSNRSYAVPRAVTTTAPASPPTDPVLASAFAAATIGRVSRHHLPVLASSGWRSGSEWAQQVLEREAASHDRKAQALLAAIGYDPTTTYYGVLDPGHPDHELIVSVAREGEDDGLERWDGLDWGTAELGEDGVEFVVLDDDVLVDVLRAVDSGSAGVMLRPFQPKAWTKNCEVLDYPLLSAAPPQHNTGVMVAFYPPREVAEALAIEGGEEVEDLHLTLVYLGDTEEEPVDYAAVQRAVARWARRMNPVTGEIAGTGLFTAGEDPVTYASVDAPALPQAREMLVRILASEGVRVNSEHGYTPHITLAFDDVDVDVENHPLEFHHAVVAYGDDLTTYDLGTPAIAAAGAGPDRIYAIVDEFDTTAVLDLLRVVPGPIAYRRSGGKWVKDQNMLMRLMGVDPPPVVVVAPEQTASVLSQVDAYDAENPDPVTAASLMPAQLQAYWAGPEGQAKIRWGTGGDFDRCRRQLAKYLPTHTVSGACANLHHLATGKWPGRGGANHEVTVAAAWDESKFNRAAGGRFGDKPDGPKASTQRPKGSSGPAKAPPGSAGGGPGSQSEGGPSGADIRKSPWKTLDEQGNLAAGLPPAFWSRQPEGFRDWLVGFLRQQRQARMNRGPDGKGRRTTTKEADDGRNEKGEQRGAAGDGKRDTARGEQRSQAQKDAQKKAASRGGKESGAANLVKWRQLVPPRYRRAMDEFVKQAAHVAEAPARREDARKRDADFDVKFAKEGLGEARRRELFDRQIVGQNSRLRKAGISGRAVDAVIRKRVADEKAARNEFEANRRLTAEQERIRRLQAGQSLVAASMMPGKLKSYWARGKGAAQIRWGTGGDFDRCTKALAKYLRPDQVKGACANLHHLATGTWPGKGRSH